MVDDRDRAYFQRVAETLRRHDVSSPASDLAAVTAALHGLWASAARLGHVLPDDAAQRDESQSHQALYERYRALQRIR